MDRYLENCLKCSRQTTNTYSTSFSIGIRMLKKGYHNGIYAIYGFVRFADEIVDTFFQFPQRELLENFKSETFKAIEMGFSTNPILHSFQWAVHQYYIDKELIEAFLHSMELDLTEKIYPPELLKRYIYGSAEVVGLMCLKVFYQHEPENYNKLVFPARKLGEAFQKVNFLRDAHDDYKNKGRIYFTSIDFENFIPEVKKQIEDDIGNDFSDAYLGIIRLHRDVRFGVYLAYLYYLELLKIIRETSPAEVLNMRCSVPGLVKLRILFTAAIRNFFLFPAKN